MVKSAKDLTGTIIAQKYKLLKLLGEGGMGTVYQAQDVLVNRTVALKVLKSETDNEEAVRRFQREATIAARIDSPYCVGLLDFGVADDRPFLVMPYVDGRPLSDVIDDGPLPPPVAIDIFLQICEGLEAAHLKGVVHRDIKPSNVILIPNGNAYSVKILDFGIAKLREPDFTAARTMTGTGEFLGSPKYMSPEQCEGLPADQRSDIYSLGILMYETLSGEPPFKDDNVFAIIEKHRKSNPEALYLTDLSNSSSRYLQSIVFRCLEKMPESRYRDVAELRSALENWKVKLHSNNAFELPAFNLAPRWSAQKLTNSLVIALVLGGLMYFAIAFGNASKNGQVIEGTQIPLNLPSTSLTLDPAEKNEKMKYFDAKLSAIRRMSGENVENLFKICQKAGDFFKAENEPAIAMKYYGNAAIYLAKLGLGRSVEMGNLFINEAECCMPLKYNLEFHRDRLQESLDIFLPLMMDHDEFAAVQFMRASCLKAQIDLELATAEPGKSSWRAKAAEDSFRNVEGIGSGSRVENLKPFPQYLVQTFTATGDYFYKRALTASDSDARARSIILGGNCYNFARLVCAERTEYKLALASILNRLGMLDLLKHSNKEAIYNFKSSLALLATSSDPDRGARGIVLLNLAGAYLKEGDYSNWIRSKIEIVYPTMSSR